LPITDTYNNVKCCSNVWCYMINSDKCDFNTNHMTNKTTLFSEQNVIYENSSIHDINHNVFHASSRSNLDNFKINLFVISIICLFIGIYDSFRYSL